MKKIVLIAIAALGFNTCIFAQNKAANNPTIATTNNENVEKTIEKNAFAATEKLEKTVGTLSKEQKVSIQHININAERRKQLVMQMKGVDKNKMFSEIETNRKNDLLNVLNDNQEKKLNSTTK